MRTLLCIIMLSLAAVAEDFTQIARALEKDYAGKQRDYNNMTRSDRYKWEFVKTTDIPWCCDEVVSARGGELLWVDGYGQIARKSDSVAYIGVRSWVDRENASSRVTRVYKYVKSEDAWKVSGTIKIVQTWDAKVGWVCEGVD